MANFNIERIRFRWTGDWLVSTDYVKDDVVRYQGKTYVCLVGHQSDASVIYPDVNYIAGNGKAAPKWELMFDGNQWRGDWQGGVYYHIGDIVKWKGYVYQNIIGHESSQNVNIGLTADISNWILEATTYNWTNTWTVSVDPDPNVPGDIGNLTYYDLGDVVIYNGITYICIEKHTASSSTVDGLEIDEAKWAIVTRSDNWRADWTIDTRYFEDDVIKYGAIVYRCVEGHTSAASAELGLEQNDDAWVVVLDGIEYKGNWAPNTRYKKHDLVKSGGTVYRCNEGHTSDVSLRLTNSFWDIWVLGLEYEQGWDQNTEYNIGDIVLYGGYTYTALTNNVGSVPSANGLIQDTGDWELLKQGYRFIGEWNTSTAYLTGDVVRNSGYLYLAVGDSTGVYPDADTTKWQVLVTGRQFRNNWIDDTLYYLGDVVSYAGTLYICINRHTGTESDTRPDLDIENTNENYWRVLIQGTPGNVLTTIGDIRSHTGVEHVRQPIGAPGSALKTNNSVALQWQNFEEVPQVFYVSIDGLDATGNGFTINAPFRTVKYACDYIRENLGIYKISTSKVPTIGAVDSNVFVAAAQAKVNNTLAATAPNLSAAFDVTNPRTGKAYFDLDEDDDTDVRDALLVLISSFFTSSATSNSETEIAFRELVDYLNSRAEDFASETVTSNSVVYPVVINTYPNTTVLIKTGIYEEILPIRVPRNCALVGDELRSTVIQPAADYTTTNMFYVNNGSGLRNMTLQGLSGTLGDVNIYFTRRPTAGAFVSLDPGSGPDDQSVWILNKSCYVQNITTFGTACIGMKVDGSLHNGGNKSVTANDFTQVLDNGIGYWAINGGRSELVSVFTYFCHIGYLAENGGILRATNGNNSYGLYGSVAEGVDDTEVPISAKIDNQTKEAETQVVHTNGDSIVAFGYKNAGQGYSQANTTIAGTGANATAVYEEFRQNAVSNIRVLGPGDSSIPGGLNYQYLLNNAQDGDIGSITLAAADSTGTSEKYVGMRIVIVSGTGVGQYGYISAYDPVSKIAIISKEYNDTQGWENLDPGRPIETSLDTTTRYSLEPRVIIEEPEFTITEETNTTFPTDFLTPGGGVNDKWAKAVQYSNGTYIIINRFGETAISTDGLVFTADAILGSGAAWNNRLSGSSGNNMFFQNGPTVYNYDTSGSTWTNFTISNYAYTGIATNQSTGISILVSTGAVTRFTPDGSTNQAIPFSPIVFNCTGIAYGNGVWVVIQTDGTVRTSVDEGVTWTSTVAALDITATWNDVTYGNGRFVAVGDGGTNAAYSFDGVTWYSSDESLELLPGSGLKNIIYTAGEFIATTEETPNQFSVNYLAKSKDGWVWRWFDEDSTEYAFNDGGYRLGASTATPEGVWFLRETGSLNSPGNSIFQIETGAEAIARVTVSSSRIEDFIMYDPGSNYLNAPTLFVADPENTIDATYTTFLNDGVLPQPIFTNRGQGFVTATSTITGNGLADNYQTGKTIFLKDVSSIPGPGANISINGIDDVTYRLTKVVTQTGTAPNIKLEINISPTIKDNESPNHEETVTIREQYSQIRLTGHDFLDIGTGNVNTTRYPQLYLEGQDSLNEAQPFNETVDSGGGRVFYTSTDQDGNFRVGELFTVEQATGSVTVNADLFELNGLTELSLGGIIVGGSKVVVREFSKDGTFVDNSNNIVPTEAAIIKYLESRISSGGSDALTNTLIAGQVKVSGNNITTTSNNQINISVKVDQKGGIDGDYLALQLFGI